MISIRPFINVGIHFLAWMLLGFLQLFYIPLSWNVDVPLVYWFWQSWLLGVMILVFYVNAKVIVPRTIVADKTMLFVIWVLLCIGVTQLIAYIYATHTQMHERIALLLGKRMRSDRWLDNLAFTGISLVLALSTCWSMLTHWQRATQREKALQQDQVVTELNMLKMQINPHFFFNSLNSVYALTYLNVEDSRTALLTLSRMMRYLLYNTREELTTLAKEVSFLKDYISVMALRATKKVSIDLKFPESLQNFPVSPMLLLPFVENAFKHGVDATESGVIKIHLFQRGARITLEVVNDVFPDVDNNVSEEGGVGLSNTYRRLQLLYPDRHLLHVGINDQGKYEVMLTIDLTA